MKKHLRNLIATVLVVAMLVQILPGTVYAYLTNGGEDKTIYIDGKPVTPDGSWEEQFPYGTFAFNISEAQISEDGGETTLSVYRLGGSKGSAQLQLAYFPAIAEIAEGQRDYTSALSSDDLNIRVEDPLPIAAYQPRGKAPAPEAAPAAYISVAEPDENDDVLLTLVDAGDAESIAWYMLYEGKWTLVEDAVTDVLPVASADYAEYDFRAVYKENGTAYATATSKGAAYVKPAEAVLPPIPENIDLNPEITYTPVPMTSDDKFSGYYFVMTFAEGETVKDVKIDVIDDDEVEADEFGVFTIVDCDGGTLYDTANKFTLHVTDNDGVLASELGFAVTAVTVDKAEGTAVLTVARTGGVQQMLTIEYATGDGTAIAGRDYMAASGTLAFYAGVTEQQIEIPLINDKIATDDLVTFTVALSDLKGDSAGVCTLTETSATVSLFNSAASKEDNVATNLIDFNATDVSGAVTEAAQPAAPMQLPSLTGSSVDLTPEPVTAKFVMEDGGELNPLTYMYLENGSRAILDFGANKGSWKPYTVIAGGLGNTSTRDNAYNWAGNSWVVTGNHEASNERSIDNMPLLYDRLDASFSWECVLAGEWTLAWYKLVYTYPSFYLYSSRYGGNIATATSRVTDLSHGTTYQISYTTSAYLGYDIPIDAGSTKLGLAVQRNSKHNVDNKAKSEMTSGTLRRRYFNSKFGLKIYTSNDALDTAGSNPALTEVSGVYGNMKPTITLKSGGTNSSGQLYVGSVINVKLATTPAFQGASTNNGEFNVAVYLTDYNTNGGSLYQGTRYVTGVRQDSDGSYDLKLMWDGLNTSQLSSWLYNINIVMERKQTIEIDLSPSIPRDLTADPSGLTISTDPADIASAQNEFWRDDDILIYYAKGTSSAPYFTYNPSSTYDYRGSRHFTYNTQTNSYVLDKNVAPHDIQAINFRREKEDIILFNGVAYAGDETIPLSVADLANSKLTFRYYDKDYLTAASVMRASISDIGIYLDRNMNGQIDGFYNKSTGYFVLDKDDGGEPIDEFILFMEDGKDYDESLFTPVAIYNGNNLLGYQSYFAKINYTMTPRSLVVPQSASVDDSAQVLPALITDVTNPDAYSRLTEQQKEYRYVVSGFSRAYYDIVDYTTNKKDADYSRSSDGHTMYGAVASAPTSVDVPLGGDKAPAHIDDTGKKYVWEPDYYGNLLFPFSSAEPVFIEHSLAGDNTPIAAVDANGTLEDATGGLAKLNNYLGTFGGNDTFALMIQPQEYTLEEIAAAYGAHISGSDLVPHDDSGTPGLPKPEFVGHANPGAFPNSDYLKVMDAGGDTEKEEGDSSEADSGVPEFDVEMGIKLPTLEISATDYIKITMDGYEVGFTIGIPLGGYNSSGDAGEGGAGGSGSDNWSGPKKANAAKAEDMGKILGFLKSPSRDKLTDDSYDNATRDAAAPLKDNDDPEFGTGEFKVEFSISLAILFKYNPIDNAYYFSQFGLAISAELKVRLQYRLSFCPIVYVYVEIGLSLKLGTGLTVDRLGLENPDGALYAPKVTNSVDDASKETIEGLELKKGESVLLTKATPYKAANLYFDGKLNVKLVADTNTTVSAAVAAASLEVGGEKTRNGMVKSGGEEPVTLVFTQKKGNFLGDDANGLKGKIVVTALEDTTLYRVAEVVKADSDVYWNGMTLEPGVYLELGAGIGVEMLKFEIFVKVSVSCAFSFGKYEREYNKATGQYTGKYAPFSFDKFELTASLGFRVVLLFFSFEMDAVKFTLKYEKEEHKDGNNGWSTHWGFFNDMLSASAIGADGTESPIHITLPGSTSATQRVYSPPTAGELDPLAYNPYTGAPFQISGYGSSGNAFPLADGLLTGYDYRVVTVGDDNYLVYTLGRDGAAHPVDNTKLVLSKLQLTSTGDAYGLVNPTGISGGELYIPVDDDATGDLGFTAWADGDTLRVAWASYAAVTTPVAEPTEPDAETYAKPVNGETPMDATNYTDTGLFPVLTTPTPVTPVDKPAVPEEPGAAPVQSDYVSDTEVEGYTKSELEDDTKDKYFNPAKGATYAEAAAAYITDRDKHTGLLNAYNTAVSAAQKWDTDTAKYAVDLAKFDAYTAWHNYYAQLNDYNTFVQNVALNSANKTVIKTASFDTKGGNAFTTPVPVSGAVGSQVFLPVSAGVGSVTVYAKAKNTDVSAKVAAYKAYLETAYPGTDMEFIRDYRLKVQQSRWEMYGDGSELFAVVGAGTPVAAADLGTMNLESLSLIKSGADAYIAAYTTSELFGNGTHTVKHLYLRTLTITGGNPVWGPPILLRTLIDNDLNEKPADANIPDGYYVGSVLKPYNDPYFANVKFLHGRLGSALPEGEGLSTLADDPEDFLLFEMNGSTFVMTNADITAALGANPENARIRPFFSPAEHINPDGSTATPSATGRTEVTIGADGDGNISAVYVGGVSGSLNNAIYLTKYEPSTSSWGAGIMLAMKDMQIHEDGVRDELTNEELEAKYLAALYDNDISTVASMFTFSNLQIALGVKKSELGPDGQLGLSSGDGERSVSVDTSALAAKYSGLGELTPFGAPELDTLAVTESTLVVLTQGTLTELELIGLNEEIYPKGSGQVGVYAISYGVGAQQVGDARLRFSNYNFAAGYELRAGVSFANTGDITIRGSKDNPITVSLYAKAQKIAEWLVEDNILPGQTVNLVADCVSLETALQQGDEFYFTVTEDATYTSEHFASGNITLLTVENKPELGFEQLDVISAGVDANGKTIVNADILVSNRGNTDSTDVYLQFAYQSGVDTDGKPVFSPVDLRNHSLTIGEQLSLGDLGLLGVITQEDLEHGVLHLYNNTAGSSEADADKAGLRKGYARRVKGSFTVPASYYTVAGSEKALGSLNLRVEIFSDADESAAPDKYGVYAAVHGEYDTSNNSRTAMLEQRSFFAAADKIVVAQGNTLRLPVTVTTTAGSAPVVTASEISTDENIQLTKNLGILYYQSNGDYANGKETGVVVVMPKTDSGSGVIQLRDERTNSTFPIAFNVSAFGEGTDIYKDNNRFTFKNKNGGVYNPDASAGSQDWDFRDNQPVWASGGLPFQHTLSLGKIDTSFTFTTVAESIKLFFYGEVEVSSNLPGFQTRTLKTDTSPGAAEAGVVINFNQPVEDYSFEVTIKVKGAAGSGQYAYFDKLIESYKTAPPSPADDDFSPRIYWSRSFPATASIKVTGGVPEKTIDLVAYVLDDTGIASLTVGGVPATGVTKSDESLSGVLWAVPIPAISGNKLLTVVAVDSAGNSTSRTVIVDWFYEGTESTNDAKGVAVPDLADARELYTRPKSDDSGGTPERFTGNYVPKTDDAFLNPKSTNGDIAVTKFAPQKTDNDVTILAETPVLQDSSAAGFYEITNGFYRVMATDSVTGAWSLAFMAMDKIDPSLPMASISESPEVSPLDDSGRLLLWSAYKSGGTATINPPTINNFTLDENYGYTAGKRSVGGAFPIQFNGLYALAISDSADNAAAANVTVTDIKIDASGALSVDSSWNQDRDNGAVTVNPAAITGGLYDSSLSNLAANVYVGSYEYLLVPEEEDFAGEPDEYDAWLDELLTNPDRSWSDATTFENLVPGNYTLYVRDAQDPANAGVVAALALTVEDEAITFLLTTTVTSGGSAADGKVTVVAAGGKGATGLYQYLIVPIEKLEEPYTLEEIDALVKSGEEDAPKWELTNLPIDSLSQRVFDGLSAGSYQVVVRPLAGVTHDELEEAGRLAQAYEAAKARAEAAEAATNDIDGAIADKAREIELLRNLWDDAIAGGDADATAAAKANYRRAISVEITAVKAALDTAIAVYEQVISVSTDPEVSAARSALAEAYADFDAGIALAEVVLKAASDYEKAITDSTDSAVSAARDALADARADYATALAAPDSNEITEIFGLLTDLRTARTALDTADDESLTEAQSKVLADALTVALTAYNDAVNALLTGPITSAINAEKVAADAALVIAGNAYDDAVEAILTKADSAYGLDDTLWLNALTDAVTVTVRFTAPPSDDDDENEDLAEIKETDVAVYIYLKDGVTELTEETKKLIYDYSQNNNVVLVSEYVTQIIIEDSLPPLGAFDDMILILDGAPEGNVVTYTDGDGVKNAIRWSLIYEGRAYYVTGGPGKYAVEQIDASFSDVGSGFWGRDAVSFVFAHALFNGISATTFGPNENMTRAMFVTVLGRLHGVDVSRYTGTPFEDVEPGAYYAPYVDWAAQNGIVTGYSDTRFGPDDPVTREQMCAIFARYFAYAGISLPQTDTPPFADSAAVSVWAKDAVDMNSRSGLIVGKGANLFDPAGKATRAEVATIYTRLIEKYLLNFDISED
jgi:hypothetical protein